MALEGIQAPEEAAKHSPLLGSVAPSQETVQPTSSP